MKKEFESYFQRLADYSMGRYGTRPTVCYTSDLPKDLLVSSPNDEGEVEWRPKPQDALIDWGDVEAKIGFEINQELKAYYSTYLFLSMAGKIENCHLYFQPIPSQRELKQLVMRQFADAQEVFPNTQRFILGDAVINGVDSFFLYYDNSTSTPFCYEDDTKTFVHLPNSLTEMIDNMEAID